MLLAVAAIIKLNLLLVDEGSCGRDTPFSDVLQPQAWPATSSITFKSQRISPPSSSRYSPSTPSLFSFLLSARVPFAELNLRQPCHQLCSLRLVLVFAAAANVTQASLSLRRRARLPLVCSFALESQSGTAPAGLPVSRLRPTRCSSPRSWKPLRFHSGQSRGARATVKFPAGEFRSGNEIMRANRFAFLRYDVSLCVQRIGSAEAQWAYRWRS